MTSLVSQSNFHLQWTLFDSDDNDVNDPTLLHAAVKLTFFALLCSVETLDYTPTLTIEYCICTHCLSCIKLPITLSSLLQLDAITRQCRFWTGQPMTDIFRPTQPLDGRVVYRSKASAALSSVIHLWLSVLWVVLWTTGVMHWLSTWEQLIKVRKATVCVKAIFTCVIVKYQTANWVYGY